MCTCVRASVRGSTGKGTNGTSTLLALEMVEVCNLRVTATPLVVCDYQGLGLEGVAGRLVQERVAAGMGGGTGRWSLWW